VFGYHEVFHALTLVGAALHFVLVLKLVRAAGA
jgi:hemolysin III